MFEHSLYLELQLRWKKVQKAMRQANLEACLLGTNVNLLYLSGRVFGGYIYITTNADPIFFVKRPVGLTGDQVAYIRKPEDIPTILRERAITPPQSLALEIDQMAYSEIARLAAAFNTPTIENATQLLKTARLVKTPNEIAMLRDAGRIHCEAYRRVPSLFSVGMTDLEFSAAIEHLHRKMGSMGLVRIFGQSMEMHMGSVLAGENAETPSPYDFAMGGEGLNPSLPVSCNGTVIADGMTVMVDIAGAFTTNMTDMTRVFSLGKLPELATTAHNVCLEIEAQIAATAKPGTPCADLYNLALKLTEKHGLSAYFMGTKQQAGFIGHGIGLELNEAPVLAPRSREVLMEGMTLALEPKMVIPGVGAVGVENSYIVTAKGIENVTPLSGEIVPL